MAQKWGTAPDPFPNPSGPEGSIPTWARRVGCLAQIVSMVFALWGFLEFLRWLVIKLLGPCPRLPL